ncbi:MAG: pantoate--beta-alanine ligase [Gammaproteobacteria bacterium]|nr:pantoate--beta-alanine ligase [Gammaproteobacteria bacterium]MBU1623947.1 pantoate--beta-alanine ligase [Gammaproteobacteria bacterium]MBU1982164.1 pantoate--beta-alanine ligase [Gammaproteobacteria bacterium]
MQVIHSVAELRARLAQERSIAFVPTMGNLHAGHVALVEQARQQGKCVVVSIFVNPLQFGPNEDFDKYPRTLEADCEKLQGSADIVFAPAVAEMYPEQQSFYIELPPIASELCGMQRPGHFRGMATVVLKLLNLVQPQVALFGKKDYQQLEIIRQMVTQFNLPVSIVGGETVRAIDSLALSSRNQYLSDEERTEAPQLHLTLAQVGASLGRGVRGFSALEDEAMEMLAKRGWQVEYVSIRCQQGLGKPKVNERQLVVLAAARLGVTRLIDNLEVCL